MLYSVRDSVVEESIQTSVCHGDFHDLLQFFICLLFSLIFILACIVMVFVILSISSYFSSWSTYFLSCSREDWGSS